MRGEKESFLAQAAEFIGETLFAPASSRKYQRGGAGPPASTPEGSEGTAFSSS